MIRVAYTPLKLIKKVVLPVLMVFAFSLFVLNVSTPLADAKKLDTITGAYEGDGNDVVSVKLYNVVWKAWDDAYKHLNESKNGGAVKICKSVPYNNEVGYLIGSGGRDGDRGSTSGGWTAKDIAKASPIECTSVVRNKDVNWRCNIRAEVERKYAGGSRTYSKTYVYLENCNRITGADFASSDAADAFVGRLAKGMCKNNDKNSAECKSKMNDIYKQCTQDKNNDSDAKKDECIKNEINKTTYKDNGNIDSVLDSAKNAAEMKCVDSNQTPGAYGCSDPDNSKGSGKTGSGSGSTSCKISGAIGWVVCPLSVALGGIADGLYKFLSGFLEADATMFSTTNGTSGSFLAYQSFLPIANIILAILFILIIYSEATGNGFGSLSNYTVKKMLPRLIIFAILVNISWWICAAAVDFSNILGANLKDFFSAIGASSANVSKAGAPNWKSMAALVTGGVGLGAAAAGAVVLFSQLIPLLLFILLIILVLSAIILLCILREAGLVLLCTVAPIAFACAAMSKTKNIFDKWLKFFMALIMVYPLVSLIYGASALASVVIDNSTGSDAWLMNVVAQAIKVVPLAAVPMVIMTTLDSMGVAGAKINGLMRKGLKGARGGIAKSSKQNFADSKGRRGLLRAQSAAADANAKMHESLGLKPSYKTRQHQAAYATAVNEQHDANVKNAQLALIGTSQSEQKLIARTGKRSDGKDVDVYTREAAIKNTFSKMSANEANETILQMGQERAGKTAEQLRKSGEDRVYLAAAEELNKGDKATMGKGAVVKIMNGGMVKQVQGSDMTIHAKLDMEQVARAQMSYVASKSEKDLVGASAGEINGWSQTIASSIDAAVAQDSSLSYGSFAPAATPINATATTMAMPTNSRQVTSQIINSSLKTQAQAYVARRQSVAGVPLNAMASPDTDSMLYKLSQGTYEMSDQSSSRH